MIALYISGMRCLNVLNIVNKIRFF